MANIRIVDADFYFAPPINALDSLISEFRGTPIHKVPVIRIFGATDDGHKTCLHVHGVFPYIYIPHDGKENYQSLCYKLANAIDKTLNIALGQAASKVQHVYKINLISGIPYYGYHAREHQFFKIYFFNPHLMRKVCTFLENGTILDRVYQPHEAHIPYIQQFMIDYNLHGMSFIQISEIHHRQRNGIAPIISKTGNYVLPATIPRISRSDWECDARADTILNVRDVSPNAMTNPGISAIWADERQRRVDVFQSSQVSHCLTHNRSGLEPTQSHIVYHHQLLERLLSSASLRNELQEGDTHNVSVYPAETPECSELLSSSSVSLDISYMEASNEDEDFNDAAGQKLYEVLCDLAESNEVAQRTSIPEDSILSQPMNNINLNENMDSDEEEENHLDLSLPLEITPLKQYPPASNNDPFKNLSDSCFLNIPQFDGAYDLRSNSIKKASVTVKNIAKSVIVKSGRNTRNVTQNAKSEMTKKSRETTKSVDNLTHLQGIVKKVGQSNHESTAILFNKWKTTEQVKSNRSIVKSKKRINGNLDSKVILLPKKKKNGDAFSHKSRYLNENVGDVTRKFLERSSQFAPKRTSATLPKKSSENDNDGRFCKLFESSDGWQLIKKNRPVSPICLKKMERTNQNKNLAIKIKNKCEKKKTSPNTTKSNAVHSQSEEEINGNIFEKIIQQQNRTLDRCIITQMGTKSKITLENNSSSGVNTPSNSKLINGIGMALRIRANQLLVKNTPPLMNITKIETNCDSFQRNEIEICGPNDADSFIPTNNSKNRTFCKSSLVSLDRASVDTSVVSHYNLRNRKITEYKESATIMRKALLKKLDEINTKPLESKTNNQIREQEDNNKVTKSENIKSSDFNTKNVSKMYSNLPSITNNLEQRDANEQDSVKNQNNEIVNAFENCKDDSKNCNTEANKKSLNDDAASKRNDIDNTIIKIKNPNKGSLLDGDKFKGATKYYKKVSIKKCLNNMLPCNHFKRQCSEIKKKSAVYNNGFSKNTVSYSNKAGGKNNILNEHLNDKDITTKLKDMPILDSTTLICSSGKSTNDSLKKIVSNKLLLKENVAVNSAPTIPVSQKRVKRINKSKVKAVMQSKSIIHKQPQKIMISPKILRCRKKLSSKILEQEIKKDMTNYIALQSGKRPKFNLIYGRNIPVVPLNAKKFNYTKFPNTQWSSESTTPTSSVIVLENRKLAEHEKYDLSTLIPLVSNIASPQKMSNRSITAMHHNIYLPNNIDFQDPLYAYDILDYNESLPHTCNFSKITNALSDIHLNNFDYPDVNILNFDGFLEDIDKSPNSVNSSSAMNDNDLNTDNIDLTFNFTHDNMHETLSDSSLTVIDKEFNTNIREDTITLEDVDVSQIMNADFQFILDKNNYRSQITMEKFRYIKMKQDRAFGNSMKQIFRIVENGNINGRLIIEDAGRQTELENSILDDDSERNHFFLNKTVRFSKRVLVRKFISSKSICEQLHQDFSYRLDSSDLLQWINLKRSRTYDHLLSLDGPNDSSDEDECSQVPKKKAKTILKKPSYKSLPLMCGKLSQVAHTGSRNIQFPPDTAKIDVTTIKNQKWMASTISSNPQLSSSNISSNITNCDKNVPSTAKRKLKFQEMNINALDKSIAEESTSCRYSGNICSPNIRSISPHSNKIVKCTRIKPEAASSNIRKCDYKPVFDEAIKEDDYSSDDLFSDEEDSVMKYLTKSERYDLETNYAPKASTSAMKSSGDTLNNMSGTCNVIVTPLKGENNTLFEGMDKINATSYSGASSDILSHSESLNQIDLDTTITQSYSNEDYDSLSLGNITTFRKVKELDNTLTQPQNLTQNLTIYESSPKINYKETTDGFYEIVPKYKPPTKEFIQSTMLEFNIPIVRSQSPFYGNANDVTGPVEVGMRSLYIRGKTSQYLSDFHDCKDAFAKAISNFSKTLNPDQKFTSQEINNLKMTFFGNETCAVETVCKPPSKADVELWLTQKKIKLQKLMHAEKSISTIQTSLKPNNDTARNTNLDVTNSDDTSNKSLGSNPNNSSESSVIVSPTKIIPLSRNSDCVSKNAKQLLSKIAQNNSALGRSLDNSCQITGATLNNTYGFQMPLENLQNARAVHEHQHLTVLVMELHVQTRGDFKPNPELDALCAIFFAIFNDTPNGGTTPRHINGLFALNTPPTSASQSSRTHLNGAGVSCNNINYFDDEVSLINGFIAFLLDCDPDILVGYEIQMLSWGYLIDRSATLGINLYPLLSRIEDPFPGNREKHEDAFGDLYISGRIVLDLWRILKHEIALQSYTFENIVYHILHQRVPLHSFRDLTGWWSHRFPYHRHKTVEYYLYRVRTTLQLIDQLDIIGRTSEMARLFGILFYEVLSRGSQFRVESMMLRLAKPLKYIPVSPSVQQRAKMRAPEFLPLILEPESKLYTDPVIVLDFQSLYPSIIIAYNYCFSTCIGRVEHLGNNTAFEFGATQLRVARRKVRKLLHANHLNFSPCGVAFVKDGVRQGILPRMLQDILDTRLMVKKSMKIHKDNKTLQRVLHSRQLGLKLIANVTYGYTAANFSGRMPAVEVGDSVVAKGRETLLRAIKLVESHPTWNGRVVYGDTDSLFVLVPGQCRAEAFRIGAEIAEAVTADNPSPVRLKLEKVYQPCILQTKKRYVGYMYESPDQNAPIYEAKGIETVRRDGCPAVSKMLEKCIRILFEFKNVSQIKKYVLRQFSKIVSARASIQDLTFAKEYRGASGYRPGACVPALELTRKWTAIDKRNEPRSGERVPYVIVNGPPGLPLIRMVRSPRELLSDDSHKPNALYYITRVIIPSINRCFKLIGADLHQWFNEMPRKQYKYLPTSSPNKGKKSTISQYFTTINCATCHEQTKDGICPLCLTQPQRTGYILHEKLRTLEESYQNTLKICESCTGRKMDIQCISLDCPVLYRHIRNGRDLQQSNFIRELVNNLPRLED